MIPIADTPLPASAQRYLVRYQAEIDAIADYAERVAAGKSKFASRNRRRNATFDAVKRVLHDLCSGARRCMYCEDSCADEVEHFKPKDLYPEMVFVWENYLYACGLCNGPKNSRFAVIANTNGQFVNVTRPLSAPVTPPTAGTPALIDPRRENPLDYLTLDLRGTFYFLPQTGLNAAALRRADYTIEILRLNERDVLQAAREEAYRNYRARLKEYIHERDHGADQNELNRLSEAIRRMIHPTVWHEMKRQARLISELNAPFTAAPEAFNW